ncbi:MAG: tRNA lysidine(34) synthetase TilS [Bacilli bacterium]|nr:tRNA lysidine(34) synthetase TilS [Bacilli bacterium]
MKETIAYLNSLLHTNDTIIIGLSGGPDSMCLLDIILKLNIKLNIICAHINHNIRKESKEELLFIKEYCKNKCLKLETTTFDKKSSIEDYNELELREKRYKYFEELYKKYNAKYLFTAHHGDDLIETILMRISRGSNLKGYSGFQVESIKNGMNVIKPLVFVTKDDINKYNKQNNIPFVNDKTNDEDNYTRNRYRHTVLPFLKKEQKNVHLKYLKFSRELMKYYEFVDKVVNSEIEKRYDKKILDISKFNELDKLIQTKLIEYVLDDNYIDNLYLVSDKHVNIILDIINNPKPNIEINLPDELRIQKSYDKLKITRNKTNNKEFRIPLEKENILPNGKRILITEEPKGNSNYCTKLNSKELVMPLYIRTREQGDKMVIKNMNNYKKLKDIYINAKLSKEERENQPIVVDSSGEIVWLPGLKKSKFDKANAENYDIILWYN